MLLMNTPLKPANPVTAGNGDGTVSPPVLPPTRIREEDFYEPFADWLKNELDEATVAISLGGSRVVHQALGRGGHAVDDLESDEEYTTLCRGRFRCARRVLS